MADSIRLFTPREMLEMMKEGASASTFLQRFIKRETETDKTQVEFDFNAQVNTIAKYNSRNGAANVVNKRGFTNNIHVAPYVNEEIVFTVGDVLDTVPAGMMAHDSQATDIVTVKTGEWLAELSNRMDNLNEMQAAQALQTGTITVSGGDVSYTIDFGMDAANKETLSGGDVWGSTTNIAGQLRGWANRLRDKGYVVTDILMDQDASNLLINDTTIKASLDNRRISLGQINPVEVAGQRASYLGSLNIPGVNADAWSYDAKYESAANTYTGFFTQYRCLLIATPQLQMERVYCRIDNANTGSFRGRRFPMQYWEPNGKIGHISLESSPCVVLKNPNAIFSAIVKS